MSDHLKVLSEMFGVSTMALEQMITEQKHEKMLCDAYGARDLSELNKLMNLDKQAQQAAAIGWLESQTVPKLSSRGYVGKATKASGTAQAGDVQATSEQLCKPQGLTPAESDNKKTSNTQSSTRKHSSNGNASRDTDLTSEIMKAISKAPDQSSVNSVWNELRDMALNEEGLFTGYVDDKGLHYSKSSNNGPATLSKDAFSKRLKRIRLRGTTESR